MPSSIANTFAQTILNGLKRKSIVDCLRWSEKCRIMGKPFPGPYSTKYFPWAKEMLNCESDWCSMKAAQLGMTEICLNRTFYTIDIKRIDCLYLLPSQTPDASNFSAGRFDPALEMSPYLNELFSDVKNVGHKRAGSTNLYIRGTRSRSQLKAIPAGLIVFDELDEMTQKNLSLAEERQAGQLYHQAIKISTPTIAGTGINLEYESSTQEHFHFRCPSCSRFTELIYPESLVITSDNDINDSGINDSHLICKECKNVLPDKNKFEWLSTGIFVKSKLDNADELSSVTIDYNQSNKKRGFSVNGLYSSAEPRTAPNIAKKVIEARSDAYAEQELYNSLLGAVHEVKGARVNDDQINQCRRHYPLRPTNLINSSSIITMGVDQGPQDIYFEVDQWLPNINQLGNGNNQNNTDLNLNYRPRVIDVGVAHDFATIAYLMRRWQIRGCVIDAQPDTRNALELATAFPGFIYLCYYGEGVAARNFTIWSNQPTITVNRTAWLDLSLGRFKANSIELPSDIDKIYDIANGNINTLNNQYFGSYSKHLKAIVRKPERDKHGNPIARYITEDRVADHFAHTRNYAEMALNFALGAAGNNNQSILSPR